MSTQPTEYEVNILRLWLLAILLLTFALSFLGGAEAMVIDLNRKGYDVPHLWQRLEPRK